MPTFSLIPPPKKEGGKEGIKEEKKEGNKAGRKERKKKEGKKGRKKTLPAFT